MTEATTINRPAPSAAQAAPLLSVSSAVVIPRARAARSPAPSAAALPRSAVISVIATYVAAVSPTIRSTTEKDDASVPARKPKSATAIRERPPSRRWAASPGEA